MSLGQIQIVIYRTTAVIFLGVVYGVYGFAQIAEPAIPPLQPGDKLETVIRDGEIHKYLISLKIKEFFQIRTEQKGADINLRLKDQNGKTIAAMDSPNGSVGAEVLSLISAETSSYILEISQNDPKSSQGKYEILKVVVRAATPEDEKRIEAERLFVSAQPIGNGGKSPQSATTKLGEALKYWVDLGDDYLADLTRKQIKERTAADLLARARKLHAEGILASSKTALILLTEAQNLFREGGSPKGEAYCLIYLGLVSSGLGENRKALDYYFQALPLVQAINDKSGEAAAIGNIGLIYDNLGEKQKALDFYMRALPLQREIGQRYQIAVNLLNIGWIYNQLGDINRAIGYYEDALTLSKEIGNKGVQARAHNNIGLAYLHLGETSRAIEAFSRGLELRKITSDKIGEAQSLQNIGWAYYSLGETQRALENYQACLQLYRQAGNKEGEAYSLANIGAVYHTLGDKERALVHYNQSLELQSTLGNKWAVARLSRDIALAYGDLGKNQLALDFYERALKLQRENGDSLGEASTLLGLGAIHRALGEKQIAINYFNNALTTFSTSRQLRSEANTLDLLMYTWFELSDYDFAIFFGKQSVNIYQELRQNIKSLEKETQLTFRRKLEPTYRRLADILIKEGRIAEAEQVLGMLKEEELFDYLRRDDKVAADLKGRISLSPLEKQAFEDYEKFAGEITRTAAEFSALEKKKRELGLNESLSEEEQKQYDALKAKYDAAVTVFGKFLDDLKVKFSANDVRVAVVESDTQGILKRLNQPRTVIVSTIVGEDRLNLIVTTADIQKAHTVEIKAADVNKLVTEFREAVRNPKADPRPIGKKLYEVLFPEALRKDLENIKADTIVWSLDGTLRYVPMAALWDGERYLVERYTNAVLTLASRDKLGLAATAPQKRLVLGVGVSKPFETFNALPAVPPELCGVVDDPAKKAFCKSLGARLGVIKGLMLADDEFTLAGFENNLGKTPYVHIASHFALNPGNETDSYLLLGGGTERRFSLDKLRKTRLDGIELLTLSACNTAMTSGANSNGVEVEGFGALAQKQGARTILATLWAVADDSTKDLMTDFYARLGNKNAPGKATALRQSQLAMLNGSYKTNAEQTRRTVVVEADGETKQPKYEPDSKAPFAHPFFWSPFVIMGNWQ